MASQQTNALLILGALCVGSVAPGLLMAATPASAQVQLPPECVVRDASCRNFRGHRRGVRADNAPGGHGRSGSTFPVSAGMDAGSIRTRCSSPT